MTDMSVTPPLTGPPVSAPADAAGSAASPELDGLLLELFSTPEGRADPYSRYARMRSEGPMFWSSLEMWVSTRFEDCQLVLRDPRFGKREDEGVDERFSMNTFSPEQMDFLRQRRSMLFMNPPDHTRLRGLVSKAFTPRTVERLRPEIVTLVDDLLEKFPQGEPVDVISALAFPLPVAVIGRMLGVPAEDWPRFQSVMRNVTVLLEPMIPPDQLELAFAGQLELDAYFRELLAERRRQPQDDLISHLLAVEEGSDRLSELELISTATLLFGAGFETTTNLIGNGLYALLTHPEQLARLRSDRSLMRLAVDELLRFDSPVQIDGRQARENVDVGGYMVEEGAGVVTLLGAANRDPAHFSDPDRLDVTRDEGPPMSFGSGIHYCLGAALARAEGQVVFDRLLERFSRIELADEHPARRDRITLRGLLELPVAFSR
jgi:cytochrome P450